MKLVKVLNNIEGLEIINDIEIEKIEINNIQYDSRKVEANDMFVCINGYDTDGHLYIDNAVESGARCIIISKAVDYDKYPNIIFIKCLEDIRIFLAKAAINFYNNPAAKLKIVGITGTKGKTTTAYILRDTLVKCDIKVGIIGTNGIEYNGKKFESNRTTPESLDLQKILFEMLNDKVETVVMEVSSHALELKRVYGIIFEAAAFTNLSREHFGFHKTFDNYLNAKAKLFDVSKIGIINIDDKYGEKLYKLKNIPKISIGINKNADICPISIETNINGSMIKLSDIDIKTNMVGEFNIYNILTAYALCKALDLDLNRFQETLRKITISGRMEFVVNSKNYNVVIDFAHSVDSLEQVLVVLKKYVQKRLILVFGVGGGSLLKDSLKGLLMGKAANRYADYIIVTEDNPYDEDPLSIAQEIVNGFDDNKLYEVIIDRDKAIKRAIDLYQTGDLILIAGKGHETTQKYKDKFMHFSDMETVHKYLD